MNTVTVFLLAVLVGVASSWITAKMVLKWQPPAPVRIREVRERVSMDAERTRVASHEGLATQLREKYVRRTL